MAEEATKVKHELRELLAKRSREDRKQKPKDSTLDTQDGVKDELKKIVSNTLTKDQDRIRALQLLVDLSGYRDTGATREIDRMSNEDLVDLLYTIVLPAVGSHGVYVKRAPRHGSPYKVQWFGTGHMPEWNHGRDKSEGNKGEIPTEDLCRRCKKRPFRYIRRLLCQSCFVTLRRQGFTLENMPKTFDREPETEVNAATGSVT